MKRRHNNETLVQRIRQIKIDHPAWGYRRVWAYLHYRCELPINRKRVRRLMREQHLMVPPDWRLKARRIAKRRKIQPRRPNRVWGIDMTKIMVPTWGWMYLTVVLDWHTKKIVGYDLNVQSRTDDWLRAMQRAVNNQFPNGIREQRRRLWLISDNGSQPTSQRFMKECAALNIKQIFTCYNNPKGNADTERVMRTIKEDLVWPNDFQTPDELTVALDRWVMWYNTDYPHSSLGYATPCEFERRHRAA
jgi:transposase InsO family protein